VAADGPEMLEVLLVEDDDGDALLVEDDLAEALPDAHLLRARSLGEALAPDRESADCVLLDLGLPDTSGVQAVVELRARLATVPLVVLTGLADEAAGVAAVQAGAQDYLVKGRLEPGQLARAIRYAIGRRATEEAERELILAEAQAREVERLERGLAPRPLIEDSSIWSVSCNRPGRSRALLGGDFFDLVQDEGTHLHAVIGDVCGHGADEAAIGVNMRAAWRALTFSGAGMPAKLDTLSRVFEHERRLPRLFATMFTLDIDLADGTASTVMAGHPRPLLIDGETVRPLSREPGGAAIGFGDGPWPVETVALPPGWAILMYTDGIVEGRVGAGSERLGEAGLAAMLSARLRERPAWREHPEDLLGELLDGAESRNEGPLSDDVAMLLLGVRPGSGR
jgi:serine phosphatase RsbU (regulator of sigma subunit)